MRNFTAIFTEVSKTGKPLKESEDFAKLTALLKQALNGCLAEVWRQRSQVDNYVPQ